MSERGARDGELGTDLAIITGSTPLHRPLPTVRAIDSPLHPRSADLLGSKLLNFGIERTGIRQRPTRTFGIRGFRARPLSSLLLGLDRGRITEHLVSDRIARAAGSPTLLVRKRLGDVRASTRV